MGNIKFYFSEILGGNLRAPYPFIWNPANIIIDFAWMYITLMNEQLPLLRTASLRDNKQCHWRTRHCQKVKYRRLFFSWRTIFATAVFAIFIFVLARERCHTHTTPINYWAGRIFDLSKQAHDFFVCWPSGLGRTKLFLKTSTAPL